MKKILVVLFLLTLASCASGASLVVTGTAPSQGNAASCGSTPVLGTMSSISIWIVCNYTGPSTGIDSVWVTKGSPFTFNFTGLPGGTYTATVKARNTAGYGCPSTSSKSIEDVPHIPTLN